jgi:hypothetical protein
MISVNCWQCIILVGVGKSVRMIPDEKHCGQLVEFLDILPEESISS